ncbi:MAG: hypothetical protein RLZZ502_854, partial [Pseudomonadota bacterium]
KEVGRGLNLNRGVAHSFKILAHGLIQLQQGTCADVGQHANFEIVATGGLRGKARHAAHTGKGSDSPGKGQLIEGSAIEVSLAHGAVGKLDKCLARLIVMGLEGE